MTTDHTTDLAAPLARRSVRIDALKGLAIGLVVLGHVASMPRYGGGLSGLYYAISIFNMPLFMFLAGYVLLGREGDSPFVFLKRKFLALMVPYVMWLLFALVRYRPASVWAEELGASLLNPHSAISMWFLYVLFVFYVLFTAVRLVSRSDGALVVLAAATVGLAALPGGDFLGRANVQWLFTFFVLGYLVAKHRNRLPAPHVWMPVAAAAAFAACLWLGWPADSSGWPPRVFVDLQEQLSAWRYLGTLAFLAWKLLTALLGIAVCVLTYALLSERVLRWQAFVGKSSLGIYVTQGWLLALAVGSSVAAAIGSWALIVYVALAVALLLEQTPVLSALFLGKWPMRRPAREAT